MHPPQPMPDQELVFEFVPRYEWKAWITRFVPNSEFELTMPVTEDDRTGTTVGVRLSTTRSATSVSVRHAGWRETAEHFRFSSHCRAMYLRRLRRTLSLVKLLNTPHDSMPDRNNQHTDPSVIGVHRAAAHGFSKQTVESITLRAGFGVEGDAHAGATVKHRSRVSRDPTQPNRRQVHLLHAELLDELAARGFAVAAGELGENITVRELPLLMLPVGTRLHLGASAIVEITGLRNPCHQIDDFQSGLKAAVLDRDRDGNLIRKAGVMSVVIQDGVVAAGDRIEVRLPPLPHKALQCV